MLFGKKKNIQERVIGGKKMAGIYLDTFYHPRHPKCKEYFSKAFFGSEDCSVTEEEYL